MANLNTTRKVEERVESVLEELELDAKEFDLAMNMSFYEDGIAVGLRKAIRKIEKVMKNLDYPK